ncbi:MAG: response regulator, partial [Planctomycetota bacterium]
MPATILAVPNPACPTASATLPLVHVVDDEPAIQALFRNMAAIGGFAIATHGTGAELLAAIDPARPGCLVLDLFLPDTTGLELLQTLDARGCNLPVVFTSGMARIPEAVKAIKLGSIDFLEKPFDVKAMLAAIARAIDL